MHHHHTNMQQQQLTHNTTCSVIPTQFTTMVIHGQVQMTWGNTDANRINPPRPQVKGPCASIPASSSSCFKPAYHHQDNYPLTITMLTPPHTLMIGTPTGFQMATQEASHSGQPP